MYWSVTWLEDSPEAEAPPDPSEPRFVIHRHRDDEGTHLDLRLEQDGCLVGWRIPGDAFETGAWATEKRAHSLDWLEGPGDAVCLDRGVYRCRIGDDGARELLLLGRSGARRVRMAPERALPPHTVREACAVLDSLGAKPDSIVQLLRDGRAARQRAVERLCGLGRELDGEAFSECLWRRSLEGLSLEDIHAQLRAFEVRFDLKYPPQPVSIPEPLIEDAPDETRAGNVLTILRDT